MHVPRSPLGSDQPQQPALFHGSHVVLPSNGAGNPTKALDDRTATEAWLLRPQMTRRIYHDCNSALPCLGTRLRPGLSPLTCGVRSRLNATSAHIELAFTAGPEREDVICKLRSFLACGIRLK